MSTFVFVVPWSIARMCGRAIRSRVHEGPGGIANARSVEAEIFQQKAGGTCRREDAVNAEHAHARRMCFDDDLSDRTSHPAVDRLLLHCHDRAPPCRFDHALAINWTNRREVKYRRADAVLLQQACGLER